MVFFNCNACGEALKKNQVEKHCQRCRSCQVLSCVDCGKDFWGDDYMNHTKCMTEEEKYCGKGYVPKVNKGEAKQEEWIERIQGAITKSSKNPQMSQLLESLKDYPNVPRKHAKFENFLKNSLRVHNHNLITQVWDLLMTAANQGKEEARTKVEAHSKPDVQNTEQKENTNGSSKGIEEENVHKSKREKKEERRQKAHKKEKKDKVDILKSEESEEHGEIIKPKKSKKRKRDESDTDIQELSNTGEVALEKTSKKSTKRKSLESHNLNGNQVNGTGETDCNESHVDEIETPMKKRKKMKFNWEEVITAVVKSKGEISLKKLKKKVLNEFAAQGASSYNEESLHAKFEKKVKKISGVKISKDRAIYKKQYKV